MEKNSFADAKYLTINKADQDWGIYVTTVGHQKIAANRPYPPPGHPEDYMFNIHQGRLLKEYQIVYITEGKGYFESSHQPRIEVEAGSVIFLFPDEWHTYYPEMKEGWAAFWIGFEGDYIDRLIQSSFFSRDKPVMTINLNESVVSLFIDAIKITQSEQSGYQHILGGLTIYLLGLIRSAHYNKKFERNNMNRLVEEARILMKENVDKNISSHDIADKLGLSYSWFRKLFKNYTGLSPAKYQNQLRVLRAKEHLQDTSLSVKEIAYKMNFESLNYFSAFFKKNTGLSPTEYVENYVLTKKR